MIEIQITLINNFILYIHNAFIDINIITYA